MHAEIVRKLFKANNLDKKAGIPQRNLGTTNGHVLVTKLVAATIKIPKFLSSSELARENNCIQQI